MKYRSLLVFGPPGAGKGTLGRALSVASGHYHLSSGDLFRGLAPDSPGGKLYHSHAHEGRLVPDDVTLEVWHRYVEGLIATNRYFPSKQLLLLDGIPRTAAQATMIERHADVLHVIVLDVAKVEILIQRMAKRAGIEGRRDDRENVIATRMRVYEEETKAILKHYSPSIVTHINGDQKPVEVLRDVLVKLSSIL